MNAYPCHTYGYTLLVDCSELHVPPELSGAIKYLCISEWRRDWSFYRVSDAVQTTPLEAQ